MEFMASAGPTPVMNAVMTRPRKNMISVLKNTFCSRRNATVPGLASKHTAHAAAMRASGMIDVTRNDVTNATAKLIRKKIGSMCGTPCMIVRHKHKTAATMSEKKNP